MELVDWEMANTVSPLDAEEIFFLIFERLLKVVCPSASNAFGKRVETFVAVIDLATVKLWNLYLKVNISFENFNIFSLILFFKSF